MPAHELTHQIIAERRLRNQGIAAQWRSDPASLVAWLGAVQAQEFEPAKWGLALRLRRAHRAPDVQRVIDEGEILRTHVMRPTWHFVARRDIVWMLELTGPRVQRMCATYYRFHGVDTPVLTRAAAVIEAVLGEGQYLTRRELGERLAATGTRFNSAQLAAVAIFAELERIICSGPRRGKDSTYGLLSERARDARALPREEALAEITRRFFQSHGPATIRDFVWWSGLTSADARRGLDMIRAKPEPCKGLTYWTVRRSDGDAAGTRVDLLPIYDEYVVAYRDREAVPHGPRRIDSRAGGFVVFQHALVIDGQIAGTWRTRRTPDGHSVDVTPLRRLTRAERGGVEETAQRYGRFLASPISLSIARR